MNKLLLAILLFAVTGVSAQFSTAVELEYLKHINTSNDKLLHRQNYHNAELLCDTLLLKAHKPLAAKFLYQLAKSYFKGGDYPGALFSVIRQRCMFPDDSLDLAGREIMEESCIRMGFDFKQSSELTAATSLPYTNHKTGWRRALIIAFKMHTKALDEAVLHSSELFLAKYPHDKNIVIQEIRSLIKINMPLKFRLSSINREAASLDDWRKNLEHKNKMVLLRREVKYFKRKGSRAMASTKLKEYKANTESLGERFYCLLRCCLSVGL